MGWKTIRASLQFEKRLNISINLRILSIISPNQSEALYTMCFSVKGFLLRFHFSSEKEPNSREILGHYRYFTVLFRTKVKPYFLSLMGYTIKVVRQMIGWINIYYNPISLLSVMVWTALARYNLIFFISHCYIYISTCVSLARITQGISRDRQ